MKKIYSEPRIKVVAFAAKQQAICSSSDAISIGGTSNDNLNAEGKDIADFDKGIW